MTEAARFVHDKGKTVCYTERQKTCLRGCLISWGPGQAAQHDPGHGSVDPSFRSFRQTLIILAQTPLQIQPAEGAFHHPTPGQYLESMLLPGPAHQLQIPATRFLGPLHQLAAVGPVGPNYLQPGILPPADAPTPAWRRPGPVCWPDAPPLPATAPGYRPLCGACAPSPSCPHRNPLAPFFGSLYRLAVDDRCAGAGLAALRLTGPGPQGVMRSLPGSVPAPSAEVMKGSAPRWQIMRQHPPRASGAQHIADGIHHLPAGVFDGTAAGFGRRQATVPAVATPGRSGRWGNLVGSYPQITSFRPFLTFVPLCKFLPF